jgi:hypothetical protein
MEVSFRKEVPRALNCVNNIEIKKQDVRRQGLQAIFSYSLSAKTCIASIRKAEFFVTNRYIEI